MVTEIWVDPRNGLDTNPGGPTPASAVQTFAQAMVVAAGGVGQQRINLFEGTYFDEKISVSLVPDLILRPVGHVIFERTSASPSDACFFTYTETALNSATTFKWRFENLIFKNYEAIVRILLTGTVSIPSSIEFYSKNSVYAVGTGFAPITSSVVHITHDGVGGTFAPSLDPFFKFYALNNTVYNTTRVYRLINSGAALASDVNLTVEFERNNVYDIFNKSVSNISEVSGANMVLSRTSLNIDYNAVSPGDTVGTHDTAMPFSPQYTNAGSTAVDLSINVSDTTFLGPDSNGLSKGSFGEKLGATFWPIASLSGSSVTESEQGSKEDPAAVGTGSFPDNWTGWANDNNFFDATLLTLGADCGTETLSTATRVILTSDSDPRWVLDDSVGGGLVGKVDSPVYDFGRRVRHRGIDFWGEQDFTLGAGNEWALGANPTSTRQIEVRASNTSFLATDLAASASPGPGGSGPNWDVVSRFDTSPPTYGTTGYRYWQFRVTLRANAT